jgi:hypothetical protein
MKNVAMMPVGRPPTRGASAGEAYLDTNLDPAMTEPPIKKGLRISMVIQIGQKN